ncbi:MAG: phage holin family protein, partial [Gemmatimonadales bacterium]
MRGFISRVLITSLGLWLADVMLSRMSFDDVPSMILSALLLGIVNALVRPFIVILTLPITLLSLGIFLLIINGAMVMLVARLMPAFHLEGL